MARRLRVGILYGGRSGEHEISLRSAINVIRALHPSRYEIVPIAITKRGRWYTGPRAIEVLDRAQRRLVPIPVHGDEVSILPEPTRHGLVRLGRASRTERLDVIFPVLHGSYGEDGAIQGLLELAGLPYVGAGVLGSAAGMDKDAMKRLLREAGIPVVPFVTFRGAAATDAVTVADRLAEAGIGYPCFVKPANLGSSVGISKVAGAAALPAALRTASRYDTKVLIEKGVVGREFEIAVIGDPESGPDDVRVSVPGEVIPGREFYDYVDKYVGTGSRTIVPAHLPAAGQQEMAALAKRTFDVLECRGLARVDFFLQASDQKLFVNEINTIPGTTPISLFPQMWKASGVPFADVVDRLIALALEHHRRRTKLETSFSPTRHESPRRRAPRAAAPRREHAARSARR